MDINVELTPGMLALIPIVAVIVQTIKRIMHAAPIPEKIVTFIKEFLPIVSILVAFLILLSIYKQASTSLLPSMIVGLSASGSYSAVKGIKPLEAKK